MTSGISSGAGLEATSLQPLQPGDHLQFLYYCRLAQDMLAGQTPLFYNLYEFHTGADSSCFQPDTYYFPFSFLYAAGAWLVGMAGGWNLAGFLSLWGTCLFTWLLARRYVPQAWLAGLAGGLAMALPFRWINLCGGSPAGMAMMWIPALWLGLDIAIRDKASRGGWLAGLAILLARWTDMHVFFFGALSIPCWGLLALSAEDKAWCSGATWRAISRALLPTAGLALVALILPLLFEALTHSVIGAATPAAQRTWSEITLYSPKWQGLFAWRDLDVSNHIFIGYAAPAIIVLGWLILLSRLRRERPLPWRRLFWAALIGAGLLGIIMLALGTRGPGQGVLFKLVHRWIPAYGLVRQPAKIFCLMPPLLALGVAGALALILERLSWRGAQLWLPLLVGALICTEYGLRIHPIIAILDQEQAAYAAVAQDIQQASADQATVPRPGQAGMLVLPLWPGDSHYTSIYQHFALQYRIRMLNGYSPVVPGDYKERVFQPLASINQGCLSAPQLALLREMNVGYILLHEDLFPEKVSPFPVTFTLQQLLNHPWLHLLKQDGPVWAFKIRPEPRPVTAGQGLSWKSLGTTQRWEAEACPGNNTKIMDATASGTGYVTLGPSNDLSIPPLKSCWAPALRWLIRLRGQGQLAPTLSIDECRQALDPYQINSAAWSWLSLPITPAAVKQGDFNAHALSLECLQGELDLDIVLLAAGEWPALSLGQTLTIPAPCFFHAGHINLARDSVILRRTQVSDAFVFYGPKLPLAAGHYQLAFVFDSEAPAGTLLGKINLRQRDDDPVIWRPVTAGQPALIEFQLQENLPWHLEFRFLRQADMEIRSVSLTRLTDPASQPDADVPRGN